MKPPLCCASPGSPLRSMAMVLADRSPIVCRIFTGRNAESPRRCANSSVDGKDRVRRGIRKTLQKTDGYVKIGTVGILKCISASRITGERCSFTTTKMQWLPVLPSFHCNLINNKSALQWLHYRGNQCTFPGVAQTKKKRHLLPVSPGPVNF